MRCWLYLFQTQRPSWRQKPESLLLTFQSLSKKHPPLSEAPNSKRLASGDVDQLVARLRPLPQLVCRPCERPHLLPCSAGLDNIACATLRKPEEAPKVRSDNICRPRTSSFRSVARPDRVPTRSRWERAHNPSGEVRSTHKVV